MASPVRTGIQSIYDLAVMKNKEQRIIVNPVTCSSCLFVILVICNKDAQSLVHESRRVLEIRMNLEPGGLKRALSAPHPNPASPRYRG